jgi:hypothetical protein
MENLSEISRGLVKRFDIVHFKKKHFGILSEKTLKDKLSKYVLKFTVCLLIQLTTETEVYINGGIVLPRSNHILSRLSSSTKVLCYKYHLGVIYSNIFKYINKFVTYYSFDAYHSLFAFVIESFENYIRTVQSTVISAFHRNQNEFVRNKMKVIPKILNLCKVKTPAALMKVLSMGTKSVPNNQVTDYNYFNVIDQDLKNAVDRCFFKMVGFWPLSNSISTMNQYCIEILAQCPSNHLFTNFMYTIVTQYRDYYTEYKSSSNPACRLNVEVTPKPSIVPRGCILTVSDKNLGPVLVPYSWYIQVYGQQAVLGGHVPVLDSEGCLLVKMSHTISEFRDSLSCSELSVFKTVYIYTGSSFRLATLKVIPKIHKLKGDISHESLSSLPSRPIRGGENCPFNPYSIVLCKLLQHLHNDVRDKLFPVNGLIYPIVLGTSSYLDRLSNVQLVTNENWCNSWVVSGDFSDAYTLGTLDDLTIAVHNLSNLVGWAPHCVSLVIKLCNLVCKNCFFTTPFGIKHQSRGFPMGGHSSREILDTILLSCEYNILSSISGCCFYQRMVDDVSIIFICDLSTVHANLELMASKYPSSMPLNIQISFGYSRFLDLSIVKLFQNDPSSSIFHTFLCYKELTQFDYVPFTSNVAPLYKGCVVPGFIHRASTINSLASSRAHSYSLLLRILSCRNQEMNIIHQKFRRAIASIIRKQSSCFELGGNGVAVVTYDHESKVHNLVVDIIRSSYLSIGTVPPAIIYKSLPRIMELLCSKRSDIRKIRAHLEKIPDL